MEFMHIRSQTRHGRPFPLMTHTTDHATPPGSTRAPGALARGAHALACALLAAGLILQPAAGHAFFFGGVTIKDEKEMGRKFDTMVRANLPIVEDPEISKYCRDLVERIARSISPQIFPFTTSVILHNALNAFAVPGGYVYVFTGLLMNFESEDQVAGVLCHELAHVTQRHVANRLERAQVISLGSLLLAVAGVAAGGSAGGGIAAASIGAGQSAMLNYSRADETEADQIGMQYLMKAGYPPQGLVGGFKILRQKTLMTGSNVPTYLSTHPAIGDRINGLDARIRNLPREVVSRVPDNRRFKRMQLLLWGRYGDPVVALQRLRGDDALSLMGRGMVLSRQNNVKEAAKCFDAAVAKAPEDALVLREAGIFHYRRGDMGLAKPLLNGALSRDRKDYMASFFLARMLDDEGRHAQAQEQFKDVLRAVPDDAEVHEAMARSYGAAGDEARAYIHLTYSAMFSHRRKLAERYLEKARSLAKGAPREFERLDARYKERREIMKKM